MEKFILSLNLAIVKDMMIRDHFLRNYTEAFDYALKFEWFVRRIVKDLVPNLLVSVIV